MAKYKVLKGFRYDKSHNYSKGDIFVVDDNDFRKGSTDFLLLNGFIEEAQPAKIYLPHKVAVMLAAFVKAQDVPIKKMAVLLAREDGDGMYVYRFYGYIPKTYEDLIAIDVEVRLSEKFDYDKNHDYTLAELGIEELL